MLQLLQRRALFYKLDEENNVSTVDAMAWIIAMMILMIVDLWLAYNTTDG